MITNDLILKIVSEKMQVDEIDILKCSNISGAKKDSIRKARQICMATARKYRLGTSGEIGKYFGNRDHATVLHACHVIKNEREIYADLDLLCRELEIKIENLQSERYY